MFRRLYCILAPYDSPHCETNPTNWSGSRAHCRHAALPSRPTHWKLKNNNQFNYPQNIYCWILSCGHRGGGGGGDSWEGRGTAALSCYSLCVHFPHGLPSLLPDLVAALFFLYTTYAAAASIYAYHADPRWALSHPLFYVPPPLLLQGLARLQGEAFWACVAPFNLDPAGTFFFLSLVFSSHPYLCHVALLLLLLLSIILLHLFPSLLRSRCCQLADPERIQKQCPGDDISQIMSHFTRVPSTTSTLHPQSPMHPATCKEGMAKVLTSASYYLSLGIEWRQGEPLYAAVNCHRHLQTKHTGCNYDSNEHSSATAWRFIENLKRYVGINAEMFYFFFFFK